MKARRIRAPVMLLKKVSLTLPRPFKMLFMVVPVLILPKFFEMDGVWMALTVGELLSLVMAVFYFIKYRDMWRAPSAAE